MSYLEKCLNGKTLNLKADSNLVIFVLNESNYLSYNLSDMEKILETGKNHSLQH